ncbi:aspartyl-phosphate phosphatase Spo0E family protein [Bacillus gobiensis]|nr:MULTISPECIES: aspartyl-phosphate phosphatase Spo0E family protein [Bacillus]MED1094976.1 aspartyl-phosphate phosphatase Spo0E family protein [Bacillus capparidis]
MNTIEEKRLDLIQTARKFGLNSKETIQCSQELDNLLSKYLHEHPEHFQEVLNRPIR